EEEDSEREIVQERIGYHSPFLLRPDASSPTHRRAERPDLVDDVVSTIDVERFSGDEPSGIVREERCCRTDVIDADETAGRGFALGFFQQLVELRNAGGSARRERAR